MADILALRSITPAERSRGVASRDNRPRMRRRRPTGPEDPAWVKPESYGGHCRSGGPAMAGPPSAVRCPADSACWCSRSPRTPSDAPWPGPGLRQWSARRRSLLSPGRRIAATSGRSRGTAPRDGLRPCAAGAGSQSGSLWPPSEQHVGSPGRSRAPVRVPERHHHPARSARRLRAGAARGGQAPGRENGAASDAAGHDSPDRRRPQGPAP